MPQQNNKKPISKEVQQVAPIIKETAETLRVPVEIGKLSIEGWVNVLNLIGTESVAAFQSLRNLFRQFYAAAKGEQYYEPVEVPKWQYYTWEDIKQRFPQPKPKTEQQPTVTQQGLPVINDPMAFLNFAQERLLYLKQNHPDIYQKISSPKAQKLFKAKLFERLMRMGAININAQQWNQFFQNNIPLLYEYGDFLPLMNDNPVWQSIYPQILGVKTGTLTSENALNMSAMLNIVQQLQGLQKQSQ